MPQLGDSHMSIASFSREFSVWMDVVNLDYDLLLFVQRGSTHTRAVYRYNDVEYIEFVPNSYDPLDVCRLVFKSEQIRQAYFKPTESEFNSIKYQRTFEVGVVAATFKRWLEDRGLGYRSIHYYSINSQNTHVVVTYYNDIPSGKFRGVCNCYIPLEYFYNPSKFDEDHANKVAEQAEKSDLEQKIPTWTEAIKEIMDARVALSKAFKILQNDRRIAQLRLAELNKSV